MKHRTSTRPLTWALLLILMVFYAGTGCSPKTAVSALMISSLSPQQALSRLKSAINQGDAATVRAFLLARPRLFEQKDYDDKTPLYMAVEAGNREIVSLLLSAGCDPNTNSHHVPVIFAAVTSGKNDIVKLLLDYGARADATSGSGNTLLIEAATYGTVEILELLISRGADINAPTDSAGWNPLMAAITCNRPDLARFLILKGARIDRVPSGSPLFLNEAVERKMDEVARLLIAKGAPVNQRDGDGKAPLHYAADTGNQRIARLLISKGADLNVTDKFSRTPLHLAVMMANHELVDLLLKAGAKVNLPDYRGYTPLKWAIALYLPRVAKSLCSYGAEQ